MHIEMVQIARLPGFAGKFYSMLISPRRTSCPEVIKFFSYSTQLNAKIFMLINLKLLRNSFLLNIAEHEKLSANKYENANFSYLLAEKMSCSAELSTKKSFITSGSDSDLGLC